MELYFAAGDIHSFFTEWMIALTTAGFDIDNPKHKIIICGDLLDRGSQSVECLNFVKSMLEQDRCVYVRGNHEDLMYDCVKSIKRGMSMGSHHKSNGTLSTVAQIMNCSEYDLLCYVFDNTHFDTTTDELLEFIDNNTVDYFELGDTVFVHGYVPTTCDENRVMIVHDNWRDGGWREARWENGMELFKFGIAPKNKTIVCGHWHTSYGHSNIAKEGSEWGPDACFDTFFCYNKEL